MGQLNYFVVRGYSFVEFCNIQGNGIRISNGDRIRFEESDGISMSWARQERLPF